MKYRSVFSPTGAEFGPAWQYLKPKNHGMIDVQWETSLPQSLNSTW